jgi:hypothetical protein
MENPLPSSEGCPQGLDVSGSAELTVEASAERRGGSTRDKNGVSDADQPLLD